MHLNPNAVFWVLDLKRPHLQVPDLTNPTLNTWIKFTDEFNKKNPCETTTLIDTLRANFVDEALVDALTWAKDVPSSKRIATNLISALVSKWVHEDKTSRAVSIMLIRGKSGEIEKAYNTKILTARLDKSWVEGLSI